MAVAGLGVSYLAAAARTVAAQWGHPDCRVFLAQDSGYGFAVTRHVATVGAVILVCAITLLVIRWLVIRRAGLAARTLYSALWTALCCCRRGSPYAATAAPGTAGRFGVWQLAGLNTPLITAGVAVTSAFAAATWTLAR